MIHHEALLKTFIFQVLQYRADEPVLKVFLDDLVSAHDVIIQF